MLRAISFWTLLWIGIIFTRFICYAGRCVERIFERSEGRVPQGYDARENLFNNAVQVLVSLGMKIVDVVDNSAEISHTVSECRKRDAQKDNSLDALLI